MKRILVIFSHPALQSSRANKQLLHAIEGLEGITLHDLCQRYPDMFINVKREQALLAEHDIIVFQHPFYWYSCPAIMKEWMDLVLEYGYAYGPEAHALNGKQWLSAITTGAAPNPTAAPATTSARCSTSCSPSSRPHSCAACAGCPLSCCTPSTNSRIPRRCAAAARTIANCCAPCVTNS